MRYSLLDEFERERASHNGYVNLSNSFDAMKLGNTSSAKMKATKSKEDITRSEMARQMSKDRVSFFFSRMEHPLKSLHHNQEDVDHLEDAQVFFSLNSMDDDEASLNTTLIQ